MKTHLYNVPEEDDKIVFIHRKPMPNHFIQVAKVNIVFHYCNNAANVYCFILSNPELHESYIFSPSLILIWCLDYDTGIIRNWYLSFFNFLEIVVCIDRIWLSQ